MALALSSGFGTDEAYSLSNAHNLALSYFDHPPLHYWIAHFSQALFGNTRLVRLPFVIMFAGTGWFIFRLTQRLFGNSAGIWALLSLNLSGFFTVAAGTWVLPDGPLLLCLAAAADTFVTIIQDSNGEQASQLSNWLRIGLWLGLAGLSKYQAIALPVGMALFVVTMSKYRNLLRSPAPYLAGALALAIVSPVFIWNMENGWASILFQAHRGAQQAVWKPAHVVTITLGQILFILPWVFVPLSWATATAMRLGRASEGDWLCLCFALPLIVVVTLIPLFGPPGLPHWSMAGWIFLFPVLGRWLADASSRARRWPLLWAQASAGLLVALCVVLAVQAETGWLKKIAPAAFAKSDPSTEALAWDELKPVVNRDLRTHRADFVVAMRWNEAGKIDLALGGESPVLIFGKDPRNFAFRAPSSSHFVGHDALVVGLAATAREDLDNLRGYFSEVIPIGNVPITRGGRKELEVDLFWAHKLLRPYPLPTRD